MWTEEDIRNSRYLDFMLRKGGAKAKFLNASSEGFVRLNSILRLRETKKDYNLSLEIIKKLIDESDIKRFELKEEKGQFFIRSLGFRVRTKLTEEERNRKYLNYVLRHASEKMLLDKTSDGFVPLNSILEHEQTKKYYNLSLEGVKKLIDEEEVKQFELIEEQGHFFIRALDFCDVSTITKKEDERNKSFLNYLLHHGAKKLHLEVSSDGFVSLNSILEHEHTKKLYNLSLEVIKKIIDDQDVKQFELIEEQGQFFIRALNFCEVMKKRENYRNRKYLSYVLHHGAERMHLEVSSDGFVSLNSILSHKQTLEHYNLSLEVIKKMIDDQEEKQFELKQVQGQFFIRALDVRIIRTAAKFPVALYRTSQRKWEQIKDEGITPNRWENNILLRRPHSQHDNQCEVLIEIDLKLALEDGMEFYSTHGKLESPGIEGKIPPKYFKNVKINFSSKQLKFLKRLLRHDALKHDLIMSPDGFVLLDSILDLPKSKSLNVTHENIQHIIEHADVKKKFELKEVDGETFIRTLHGHSIKDILDYEKIFKKEITDADEFPFLVYGASWKKWNKKIQIDGITTRKNKNYIHIRTEASNNKKRDVMIEIDLKLAIADGMKFYECFNGVIATPGIDGVVAPKYFKDVKTCYTEVVINEDETIVFAASRKKWKKFQVSGIKGTRSRIIRLSNGYPKEGENNGKTYIEIDTKQAMADGIKFYQTKNGGIITPGINGIIDKKYFKKVSIETKLETSDSEWAFDPIC